VLVGVDAIMGRWRSTSAATATDEEPSVGRSDTHAITDQEENPSVVTNTNAITLDDLRGAARGQVIGPDDAGYDEVRPVLFSPDARPAAIVRVADAQDVATTIGFARDAGLELAVRSGGHSSVGYGTSDGGVVLHLGDMKAIEIDPDARTAWAETGLTAGEFGVEAAKHGLAIGFGDTASVGIGGITTGGGVGYLVRKHGLTIDNVLAAEVVTADGELHTIDAEHEPDLFWAIRGGGGNFGVVTRFRYRLSPVPSVVGGMLLLPATPDTLAGFMAAADAAPDELSAIANVMPTMPMPFVPQEQHGKVAIMALMAYAGDPDDGQRAMTPFRALAEPIADMLRPITYPELFPPEEHPVGDGPIPVAYGRTLMLDRVDREVAADILERVEAHARVPGTMFSVAQLRVLGGAYARVPADATAYAHRSSRIMGNIAAVYSPEADASVQRGWVSTTIDALRQSDTGSYVNFLADEGQDGVRAAYPQPTLSRLREIKRRYDPDNLFHRNQNIRPEA
jgi:FAD/FMN-containing dehydrogenase